MIVKKEKHWKTTRGKKILQYQNENDSVKRKEKKKTWVRGEKECSVDKGGDTKGRKENI